MPFFGLSVIIHMVVITAHRIFKWSDKVQVPKSHRSRHTPSLHTYIAGSVIIIGIFSFIFSLGVILIEVCIVEDHSSLVLAQGVWAEIRKPYATPGSVRLFATNPVPTSETDVLNPWEYAIKR